jgi:hypothetical protein
MSAVISKAAAEFKVSTNRLMAVGDIRLIFSLLAVLLTTSVNAAARPMGQRPSEQLLGQPGGAQTGFRRLIRAAIT